MKLKATFLVSVLSIGLLGTNSLSASAQDLGGWSEDQGYFTITTSTSKSGPSYAPATDGAEHSAWYDNTTGGSQVYERVNGETAWSGVYHYSRARYETWAGGVESDSGRVYGNGYTLATSGWNTGDFNTAKTYYGR